MQFAKWAHHLLWSTIIRCRISSFSPFLINSLWCRNWFQIASKENAIWLSARSLIFLSSVRVNRLKKHNERSAKSSPVVLLFCADSKEILLPAWLPRRVAQKFRPLAAERWQHFGCRARGRVACLTLIARTLGDELLDNAEISCSPAPRQNALCDAPTLLLNFHTLWNFLNKSLSHPMQPTHSREHLYWQSVGATLGSSVGAKNGNLAAYFYLFTSRREG